MLPFDLSRLREAQNRESLERTYAHALHVHRESMKQAGDSHDEKACLSLLMRLAVQAAIDICEKEGCEPQLDGILDLCRDEFLRLRQTPPQNLN